jgi:hypothetical protein
MRTLYKDARFEAVLRVVRWKYGRRNRKRLVDSVADVSHTDEVMEANGQWLVEAGARRENLIVPASVCRINWAQMATIWERSLNRTAPCFSRRR